LPIEAVFMLFVVEEAVVLVDDVPQCLEVTFWGILVFLSINS
jgi:hypothetical protein